MLLKMLKKLRLGSSIVQKTKIRYGWGFNLFKMLKKGMTEVLHC